MPGPRLLDDPGMDFAARCILGGATSGLAEVGETFACIDRITDGDPDSWLEEFVSMGRRLAARARRAEDRGHRRSAHEEALRACNYLFAGYWWAPVTRCAGRADALWEEHRTAWDLAVRNWPGHAGAITVAHPDGPLAGHWFSPVDPAPGPSPVVVLVAGFGTPVSDACMTGLDAATARGYHVVVVDGPGQGDALVRGGRVLTTAPDPWLGAVLDTAVARSDVDPDRIALSGLSQGSLFAARHAAEDPRVAALVVDPAMTDLGADAASAIDAAGTDPSARALLAGTTTRPTGTSTPEQALAVLAAHRLDPTTIARIGCPTFVAVHEEADGPGAQHPRFVNHLGGPAHVERFDSADGTGADCGIGGARPVGATVFDWLDEVLGVVDRPPERIMG